MDTYTIKFECDNCNRIASLTLEKGNRVPTWEDCPHCGCESQINALTPIKKNKKKKKKHKVADTNSSDGSSYVFVEQAGGYG